MTQRDVMRTVYEGGTPPYVPWNFGFTLEAREKLEEHFGPENLATALDNHFLNLGSNVGLSEDLGNGRVRDFWGVVWDRSVDHDIGVVEGCRLPEPTLDGFEFPDPHDSRLYAAMKQLLAEDRDGFRMFPIGFSLYERAWTLRGMENLMMDFIQNPQFVHELLAAIADWNITVVGNALALGGIDTIYFGDDWGSQHGLQMGPGLWREFIKPRLKRMYATAREAGAFVTIHSCGDVDELFDDLVEIGLNCFNPFQPEVMDVWSLLPAYRGRLAFYGGLSTQKTLPYGSVEDVRDETRRLLDMGSQGGYILSPAHAVEGDVPLENMLAFIEVAQSQPGYNT